MNESVDENKKRKNEVFDWIKSIAIAVVLAYLIRSFLFAPFVVEGTSMSPTLADGERLIVNELIYDISDVDRGDIIVFHYNQEQDYIKRIIGLPGDTIEVQNGILFINGKEVTEPYLIEEQERLNAQGLMLTGDFEPVEIGENEFFVMGDNRRNSKDSRMIGPIQSEQIVGRADVSFWPINSLRLLGDELRVGE